ncbi:hypothetical protein [Pseudomonas sp. MWU16-30317]|uniref:hypothetical protein n=1 Tax=Pseudomonas sp. MWU16-30317 TaxID=2878095 RepID=UPI001CFBB688|nr:hypothetical protein [Pseudomonas sp. MWU16-30317]
MSSSSVLHPTVIEFSPRHFIFPSMVNKSTHHKPQPKDYTMDDYWEELLEYRAAETDPLEPADDATEL